MRNAMGNKILGNVAIDKIYIYKTENRQQLGIE